MQAVILPSETWLLSIVYKAVMHFGIAAQSGKSYLALRNRPNFFLQILGKPASYLQALDRELKVPRTFAHFRWEAAHAQEGAQSGKSYLALKNRPKRFLQALTDLV